MKVKEFLVNEKVYQSSDLIEEPIISVILPTYCRGDSGLLERSIRTVINQKFTEWELIIVDDGSKDSTRDVIERLIKEDRRIIYIRNDINSGIPALRVNQGIIHARGKYIAYQFDDDQWYPNMLQDLYEVIKLGDKGFVYGKCELIDMSTKQEIILGMRFDRERMMRANTIPNNAVLHAKSLSYVYGGYDCNIAFKRLCDWDMWRRWSRYTKLVFVDKVVSRVEMQHKDSIGINSIINVEIVNYRQRVDRCHELSLNNIEEYEVDNINIIKLAEVQERLYKNHVLPWYQEHNISVEKRSLSTRRYD